MIGRHPSFVRLSRFADDDLEGADRTAVASHLQACARCRSNVLFLRSLKDSAPATFHPSPPGDLLEEILRRRDRGDRTFLPVAPPPSPTRSPALLAIAATLVLLAGAFFLLMPASGVRAGSGDLRLAPAARGSGHRLNVEYVPSSGIGSPNVVRLRGRYRAADEPLIRGPLGREFRTLLRLDDRGLFVGTADLPEDAVYAVFAVEDTSATYVDHNGGQLWEWMKRAPDGAPTLDALRQKYRVLERRNFKASTDVAREMTQLYPEIALGWAILLLHQQRRGPDPADPDSFEIHKRRFETLHRRFESQDSMPAAGALGLWTYARMIRDTAAARRVINRLASLNPRETIVITQRSVDAFQAHGENKERLLTALEEVWQTGGEGDESLVLSGLGTANRLGDSDAVAKWAERPGLRSDRYRIRALQTMIGYPELRARAAERTDSLFQVLDNPGEDRRSLDKTRAAHVRHFRDMTARLRADVGETFVAAGDTAAGLRYLERAARDHWNPPALHSLAELALVAADTASAASLLARLAVDPLESTVRSWADSALRALLVDDESVRQQIERARADMRLMYAAIEPNPRPVRPDVRLRADGGQDERLVDLLADRVTILVFWDIFDPASGSLASDLSDVYGLLGDLGIQLLEITGPEPDVPLSDLRSRAGRGEIWSDVDSEAWKAQATPGLGSLAVADPDGRIRFEPYELEDALRYAYVLRLGLGLTLSDGGSQ